MESAKSLESKTTAPKAGFMKNSFAGLLLFIIVLASCLFLGAALLESSMNYDSEKVPTIVYFTIQSNIILTLWMLGMTLYLLTEKKIYKFALDLNIAASVTTYISVTGIVYWLVLVPFFSEPGATWMFSTSNIWLHALSPAVSVFMLLYAKSQNNSQKPKPRLAILYIYPIFYVTLALLYAAKGTYLYPMFNPNLLGGWIGILISVAIICAVFTGLYLIFLYGVKTTKKQS